MNPVCSSSIQNTRPHFLNEQFAWIGGFNADFQKAKATYWTYNCPDNAVKDMLCPEIDLQQHTFISPMFLSISTLVSLLLFFTTGIIVSLRRHFTTAWILLSSLFFVCYFTIQQRIIHATSLHSCRFNVYLYLSLFLFLQVQFSILHFMALLKSANYTHQPSSFLNLGCWVGFSQTWREIEICHSLMSFEFIKLVKGHVNFTSSTVFQSMPTNAWKR